MSEITTSHFFQKGKYLITFLFFVACPYFFENYSIDASNAGRLLIVPAVALLMLVGTKQFVLLAPRLLGFAAIFFIAMLSGLFFANASSEVIYELAKYVSFVVLCFTALNAWCNHKEEVLWALRITASVLVVLVLRDVYPLLQQGRVALFGYHPFAEHHNIIAAALLALCGLQAYTVVTSKQLARAHAIINLIALVCICMLLQVRSVYFGLALASLSFGIISVQAKKYQAALSSLAVLLLMALSYFFIIKSTNATVPAVAGIQSVNSLEERVQFWQKTFLLIKDEPVLGCGAGNWQFNYAKNGINGIANLEKGITVQHPHNEILSIWAETGTIGLTVVLLVILFLSRQFWFEFSRTKSAALAVLGCSIIAIACESFFSFPKERLLCIFTMALLLALLVCDLGLFSTVTAKKKFSVMLVFVLALVFIQVIGYMRIKGEYYTKELLRFQTMNDARGMLKAGAKAESFVYASDPTSSPLAGYLGAAYYALNRPDSMVLQCQRALDLAPYDYETLSNLAFALTRYGDKNEARRLLQEALRINAKYDGAWLNLAILDYSLRKYEDAYHEILQIENVQENYPEQFKAIYQAFDSRRQ